MKALEIANAQKLSEDHTIPVFVSEGFEVYTFYQNVLDVLKLLFPQKLLILLRQLSFHCFGIRYWPLVIAFGS